MSYSPILNPHPVTGPLTDTQLRASAVPVSGTVTANISGTVPVSGTFFQATQPVSIASMPNTPVTGTFWQSTQPVSIAATVTVSGPLTDTQLRASAVPVSGTFFQATQPVSFNQQALPANQSVNASQINGVTPLMGNGVTGTGSIRVTVASDNTAFSVNAVQSGTWNVGTVTTLTTLTSITNAVAVTAPTLTKGTQGANGFSMQALKDAGRSCIAMTAQFTFAQTAETLLTMTFSVDGAATSTFSSRVITSGKKFRIQSIHIEVESLGSGTAPQRAYLRLRRNTAGATAAASPLQAIWCCANNTAIVKSAAFMDYEYPDGMELNGDGTATFGFTLETPDWVTTTATGQAKITVIGFEY